MTDNFSLTGKRAIITGTSRGLGQYFARALARAGADLIITARDKEDCEDFKKELLSIGREVNALFMDVRN